jgi:hypothetical protein
MNKIPKIYALGTRFNADIFTGPVVIEEKIDGSQFSFCYKDGVLTCRSKGQVITGDPGMFRQAVEVATVLATEGRLMPGAIYQCEYLAKPKHNVLAYARIPASHLVLFDIRTDNGTYVDSNQKRNVAEALGLEPVPVLFEGKIFSVTSDSEYLQRDSVLGAVKVEGIVIKNYALQHPESESGTAPMTAKIVSEKFKEKQQHQPRSVKAGQDEHIQAIVNSLRTEARWLKAIQHLREAGQITQAEKDIGPLVREIQRDTLEEEADWIKEQLFEAFKSEIHRGVVQGFAQYYKALLNNGMSVFREMVTASKQ